MSRPAKPVVTAPHATQRLAKKVNEAVFVSLAVPHDENTGNVVCRQRNGAK